MRKDTALQLLLAMLFPMQLLICQAVVGQTTMEGAWEATNGPFGGTVEALVQDQSGDIFAGTLWGGVFRSSDDGKTWQSLGLEGFYVVSLTVDQNGYIYAGSVGSAGTDDTPLFRSTDGGDTWTPIEVESTIGNIGGVWALAADTTGRVLAYGANETFFLSRDGGESWSTEAYFFYAVHDLAFGLGGRIFAASSGGGLRYSDDDAGTWSQATTGLPETPVFSVAVNAAGNVFAGTINGVYQSMDNGDSWELAGLDSLRITELEVGVGGEIYAGSAYNGIYESLDGGNTWSAVTTGLPSPPPGFSPDEFPELRSLLAMQSGHVLAGMAQTGISRYDGGEWRAANQGLRNTHISDLDVGQDGKVWATTTRSIVVSQDEGQTWTNIEFPHLQTYSLVINDDQHLFAGTSSGIYYSDDDGESWIQVGLDSLRIESVFLKNNGSMFASASGGGLFRSLDEGQTWESLSMSFTGANTFAEDSDGRLYLEAFDSVFRSEDDGDSWVSLSEGFIQGRTHPFALAADDKGAIYAGTSTGVYQWDEAQQKWVLILEPDTYVTSMEFTSKGELLAGTRLGIFASTDGGETWISLDNGLLNPWITSIEEGPSGRIYIGVTSNGVFKWVRSGSVGIEDDELEPTITSVSAINYPNPFSEQTTISFTIARADYVQVSVYDGLGRLVSKLVRGHLPAGQHQVRWSPQDISTGVYFCRIESGASGKTIGVMYVK